MGKTISETSFDNGTTKIYYRDNNIAPIELDSAHASQPYAVNEEFVLDADGNLYTATSPISQNDAFIVYPTASYNCKLSDSVTGQIKAVKDGLGTASTKNSTSVVTDSSDLVESGAVKDIVGWGNKNKNLSDANHVFVKSSARTFSFYIGIPIVSGKKYKFVVDVSDISGYTGADALGIRIAKTGGDISTTYGISTTAQGKQVIEMTATGNSDSANIYCFIPSTEPDNATITLSNVMFVEETVTNYTYEPYHASVEDTIPQVVSDTVGWDVGNLFDKSTATTIGYLKADGAVYSESDWRISDYIPVKSGLKITISKISGNLPSVCFYDVNKVYVSGESYSGRTTINKDIPAGVSYIRISVHTNALEQASVKYVSVNKQKADNSVIGTVEDGATASQAYVVGSHAIRNGKFITWKNAKAQGETINNASDYSAGQVGDYITKYYKKTVTVSANNFVNISIPTITGYSPVFVSPRTAGAGASLYFQTELNSVSGSDGSIDMIKVRNIDGSDHTWAVYFNVLYVKSDTLVIEELS